MWLFLSLLQSQASNNKTGLERQFERAILLDLRNTRFRHIIAEIASAIGNPYWARRQARSALIMDPTVASSYWSLSISENALLRHESSVRAARAAVTLTPKNQKHWALYLEVASQFDAASAARVVRTHLGVELATVESAVLLVRTLRQAGQADEARQHLARYLKLHGPALPELWGAQAELDKDQGRDDHAFRSARRAAVLAPASSVWNGLCYSMSPHDRDQRLATLSRLAISNAPGIGDVYRAIIRPTPSRQDRVRDLIRFGASGTSWEMARKSAFLAALTGEEYTPPYEDAEQHDRLNTRLGGDLDIYIQEVRALYIHRTGRFAHPIPHLGNLRDPADAVADTAADGLTILVPTGNRLADLSAVIASYLPAIADGVQFVFSVYADRQGTASYLRSRLGSYPNVVVRETAAEHFSKAAAINAAASFATGRFLQLLDCDCQLARPDAAAIALDRLRRAPNDVHSFGYRGMIGLRHALFMRMGMLPSFLVDAQHALSARPEDGKVETDDFLLICEFLLRYQTRHYFWGNARFEQIDLGDDNWSAEMRPSEQEYESVFYHYGEYRVVQRSDRYTYLNDRHMYRDQYLLRGNSLRIDPFLTKMRNYIYYQALARRGGSLSQASDLSRPLPAKS
ncbi:MAG: glycosyltransferase [Thalassobaculum sp.]|uniref:glycosyltransferase n=1 Tax=Thalassobaculum sp. TaxID=2022740 RepID=UPI0032EAB782